MSTKYRFDSFNEYTTRISLKFPSWHPFRNNPHSNWRKVMNPLLGEQLLTLKDVSNDHSRNQSLSTTDYEKPDTIYTIPIPENGLPQPQNLILNSNFIYTTYNGYMNWIRSSNKYTQQTNIVVNANQTLNVWINPDTSVTKIKLYGKRLDTGAEISYTFTSFVSSNSYSNTYGTQISSIEVTGSILSSKIMVNIGSNTLPWSYNINDKAYWLFNDTPDLYECYGDNRPVYQSRDYTDMYYRTPATFAVFEPDELASDILLNNGRDFIEFKIEYEGTSYAAILDVFNYKIRKTIDSSIEYIYDLYEIGVNNLKFPIEYYIDAIYVSNDCIIALARKDGQMMSSSSSSSSSYLSQGSSYYLLWVNPDHPAIEDGNLEIIKSVYLGDIPEFDGLLKLHTHINDPYSLVVSNTNNTTTKFYNIKLYYDYYVVDYVNNELTFREKYTALDGISNYLPNTTNYWNALDEHGLTRELPRLIGEKNYDYKQRLIDYSKIHKTNSSLKGVSNGINIRLGYKIQDDVIVFPDNLYVAKIDDKFYVSDPNFVVSETVVRDSNYNRAYLLQTPHSIISITVDGVLYPNTLYKMHAGSNEIIFNDYPEVAENAIIVVSYRPYTTVFNLGTSSIKDLIDSLVLDNVNATSEYNSFDLSSWPAINIMDISAEGSGISLSYYPIRITDLGIDKLSAFQDLSIEKYELTELQLKAVDLAEMIHDKWENTVIDKDRWDMIPTNQIGGGILPAYNDGIFSWLEQDGSLYGHIENPGGLVNKEGFDILELQNGVNTTLNKLEVYKDLELIGFTDMFEPKIKPGFFYIGEMQFYLYANKQRYNIPDKAAWLINLNSLLFDNIDVEYSGTSGCTPFWDGSDLYIYVTDIATAQLTGINTITNLPVSTPITGYHLTGTKYYCFEKFKDLSPLILTDLGSGLQEVQFASKGSGVIWLLSPGAIDVPLYLEYEPDTANDYSVLPVDAKFNRGYLYIGLDGTYSDSVTANTNYALFHGPGKGIHRHVFDPDVGINSGIDYTPAGIIETESTLIIPDPTGPSTIPNPNLYYPNPVGWGHDWGIDFSN